MTDGKTKSMTQKELEKTQEHFDEFDSQVKQMTMDRMNMAPKEDVESQTKLSQKQLNKSPDIYLKPDRSLPCRAKFNEDYREQHNFSKEYVQFIAENRELVGEAIEMWTKPFAGVPYEYWKVPVNKPIWGPRYLAEQIKGCKYHRMIMDQKIGIGADGMGSYFGSMAVDTTVQRLDAIPATSRRSVFMGASGF